ncbi:MAG: flagellar biosynthesis protein FlhF [Spirochaetes bacterium]|nr:flagellar biosynthesis protein FlhF [Spirochaetota bacterium]
MRYIKIRAKNYNDAMMKLKMDYGDDAIPISHKMVKEGGLFNSAFFAKDVVELTAAVQDRKTVRRGAPDKKRIDVTVDDRSSTDPLPAAAPAGFRQRTQPSPFTSLNKTIDDLNDNLNGFKASLLDPKNHEREDPRDAGSAPEQTVAVTLPGQALSRAAEPASVRPQAPDPAIEPIKRFERDFDEIKTVLNRLVADRQKGQDRGPCAEDGEEKTIKPFMDILRHNDFDPEESITIINEVRNSMSKEDLRDRYKIEKNLKDLLRSRVVTTGPFRTGNRKKIIMFMGPTGVGKTTTMAKLGAIYSLREGHGVAFMTLDNYRIAATEQLKKYAEIMNIPVHVVTGQREFKDVIASEKAEIIMVDTSGRSHRNELKISEIKSFADTVDYDFDKVLCVSANTKKSDLNDIFRSFDVMNFNAIIITKVDETSYIGNVIDVADKYNKPISYYTNGQEVPNDIVVADPDKIVDMIVGTGNN